MMNQIFGKFSNPLLLGLFLSLSVAISLRLSPGPSMPVGFENKENLSWDILFPDNRKTLDESFQILIIRQPWGESDMELQKSKAEQWQFVGLVHESGRGFALIESANEVRRYVQGEMLPDGQVLHRIGDNQIQVKNMQHIHTLKLYRTKSEPGSAANAVIK